MTNCKYFFLKRQSGIWKKKESGITEFVKHFYFKRFSSGSNKEQEIQPANATKVSKFGKNCSRKVLRKFEEEAFGFFSRLKGLNIVFKDFRFKFIFYQRINSSNHGSGFSLSNIFRFVLWETKKVESTKGNKRPSE